MNKKCLVLALFVFTALVTMMPLQLAAQSEREPIIIADFESSTFDGWTRRSMGSGDWYIYADGETPPNPYQSDLGDVFQVPEPPEGKFAAITDMEHLGSHIMCRDIALDGSYELHLIVFYRNSREVFWTPDTLSPALPWPNQQYRIDIIDPEAPMDTMAEEDVLAIVFRTEQGDPNSLDPTEITFDLSPWTGQTVRLRLAQVDNGGALRAGVDHIRLEPIE